MRGGLCFSLFELLYYSKNAINWWLINDGNLFLTVLEPRKFEIMVLANLMDV